MMPANSGSWDIGDPAAGRPLLISHRGFVLTAIENTDAAFAAAVDIGADGFETDVRVTWDGVPVCHRDETLARLGQRPERVLDSSYAAMKLCFPSVCRLADALRYADRMAIVLDIKADTERAVERIAEVLAACAHRHNVLVGTRTIGLSRLLTRSLPGAPQFGFGLDAADLQEFRANGGTWVRIAEPDLTEKDVRSARQLGFKMLVGIGEDYPGNVGPVTEDKIRRVMSIRPDAVMLDDPRLFLDLYGGRQTARD
jgi:glycerophosphoryl diester phosphodiesterase